MMDSLKTKFIAHKAMANSIFSTQRQFNLIVCYTDVLLGNFGRDPLNVVFKTRGYPYESFNSLYINHYKKGFILLFLQAFSCSMTSKTQGHNNWNFVNDK